MQSVVLSVQPRDFSPCSQIVYTQSMKMTIDVVLKIYYEKMLNTQVKTNKNSLANLVLVVAFYVST